MLLTPDTHPRIFDVLELEQDELWTPDPVEYAQVDSAPKRNFDIVLASGTLVPAGLLTAAGSLAIATADRVNPVYRQSRVGYMGDIFDLLKITTMGGDMGNLPSVNGHADDRRTWMGRLVSKASVDELWQILSIMRGDMSFVGPRPWVEAEYKAILAATPKDEYKKTIEWLATRMLVKPGAADLFVLSLRSGWMQGHTDQQIRDTRRYFEMGYITERASLGEDFAVLNTIFQRYGYAALTKAKIY